MEGKYEFVSPEWDDISDHAKDLVSLFVCLGVCQTLSAWTETKWGLVFTCLRDGSSLMPATLFHLLLDSLPAGDQPSEEADSH